MLAGCGFHLRGSYALPEAMAQTRLQSGAPHGDLARALRRELTSAGTMLSEDARAAGAVLVIGREDYDREVLSVDSAGKAREYLMTYRASFALRDAQGRELVPMQDAVLHREVLFDANAALGHKTEEEYLRGELADEMARLILDRLSAR
jgi:LPS-assembly lipoprotein